MTRHRPPLPFNERGDTTATAPEDFNATSR